MAEHGVIPEFRGEYYWLSNYATTPFTWRGIRFTTAEHAFAFAKTFFMVDQSKTFDVQTKILAAEAPGDAKKIGRNVTIDATEWDKRKVSYMREIVHAKFANGEKNLIGPLINTGAKMLVEGNNWNDTFWGRCKDKDGDMVGFNTLGVILMEERGSWLRAGMKLEDKLKEK